MKRVCLYTLLILYSIAGSAQSIQAGYHSITDFYFDFNPDTLINCNFYIDPYSNPKELPVDFNGDGIIDLKFIATNNNGALGNSFASVLIETFNKTQVLNHKDSCLWCNNLLEVNLADSLTFGDIISGNSNWNNDSIITLTKFMGLGPASTCQDECYLAISSPLQSNIIGVRTTIGNDTLYGWIRIKEVYSMGYLAKITIQDYACRTGGAIIEELDLSTLSLYPNPCMNHFTAYTPFWREEKTLILYDLMGKIVSIKKCSGDVCFVDVEMEPSGIYLIQIISDNKIKQEKIIKIK